MGTVTPAEMEVLIATHMLAEENGDPQRAVSVYTEDVEHDVVGFPGDPIRGVDAALDRYHQLVKDLRLTSSPS